MFETPDDFNTPETSNDKSFDEILAELTASSSETSNTTENTENTTNVETTVKFETSNDKSFDEILADLVSSENTENTAKVEPTEVTEVSEASNTTDLKETTENTENTTNVETSETTETSKNVDFDSLPQPKRRSLEEMLEEIRHPELKENIVRNVEDYITDGVISKPFDETNVIPPRPQEPSKEEFLVRRLEEVNRPIPGEYTDAEIEAFENEYLDAYLSHEKAIREEKDAFKRLTKEYQLKKINTKAIIKVAKQIARDHKQDNRVLLDENRISNRMYRDKRLVNKILNVFNNIEPSGNLE